MLQSTLDFSLLPNAGGGTQWSSNKLVVSTPGWLPGGWAWRQTLWHQTVMVVYSHQRKLLSVRAFLRCCTCQSEHKGPDCANTCCWAAERSSLQVLWWWPQDNNKRQQHTGKDDGSLLEPCQFMTSFTRPKQIHRHEQTTDFTPIFVWYGYDICCIQIFFHTLSRNAQVLLLIKK